MKPLTALPSELGERLLTFLFDQVCRLIDCCDELLCLLILRFRKSRRRFLRGYEADTSGHGGDRS